MNNQRVLLLTGSTGYVGSHLRPLLQKHFKTVILLTRKKIPEYQLKDNEILLSYEVFLDPTLRKEWLPLLNSVTDVVHLAAKYDFQSSKLDLYQSNVVLTGQLLHVLNTLPQLKVLHYTSTYAVNYGSQTMVYEEDLQELHPKKSYDNYSYTKNVAEWTVRRSALADKIRIVIHRPGVVVHDTSSDKVERNNGIFPIIQFIQQSIKKLPAISKIPYFFLPLCAQGAVPYIPVNYLVEWMKESIISFNDKPEVVCYQHSHPTPMNNHKFAQQLISGIFNHSVYIKPISIHSKINEIIFKTVEKLTNIPSPLFSYMQNPAKYNSTKLFSDFKNLVPFDQDLLLKKLVTASKDLT